MFLGAVRTTLKRGFGRTAGADGNGRAVLPPAAPTPVSRYRQPLPPRRSGWRLVGRIVLWLVIALVMVATAFAGGLYLWAHESVAKVSAHSVDVKSAQQRLDLPPPPNQAAIALVLGYDHRAGEGNSPSRSDTMMLVRDDPATKAISMLSFPRDMSVPIHCPGHSVFTSKINSAYATCGSKGAVETVKSLTGLPAADRHEVGAFNRRPFSDPAITRMELSTTYPISMSRKRSAQVCSRWSMATAVGAADSNQRAASRAAGRPLARVHPRGLRGEGRAPLPLQRALSRSD